MGQFIGLLIFFVIVYMAYQIGRIKGKAEILLQKAQRPGRQSEKVEEADYEEIK
jgi:hypothetical protein